MTAAIVKEFKFISERINDAEKRIGYLYSMLHKENADQISDLQDYVVETEYNETLEDLGL